MKIKFLYILIFILSVTVHAQIDSQKKSTPIPAIESKKDTSNSNIILPSKPNENNSFSGLTVPKTNSDLNVPKKEFTMFGEKFGNPGELYEKLVDKNLKSLEPGERERNNGSTTDQYFGDFKSNAKFVNVIYRDHEYPDGDRIRVYLNDDVIHPNILLEQNFKGFKLDLKPGFNKIDFQALNQGESGPNTAQFQVIDDSGNVISSNMWNLATGVKATVIIVKE
jgi:hypothetical protein